MPKHIYSEVAEVKVLATRGPYRICQVRLEDGTIFFSPPRGPSCATLPRQGNKILIDFEILPPHVKIFDRNSYQGSFLFFGDFSPVVEFLEQMVESLGPVIPGEDFVLAGNTR